MAVFCSSRLDAYFLTIIAGIENTERVASDFSYVCFPIEIYGKLEVLEKKERKKETLEKSEAIIVRKYASYLDKQKTTNSSYPPLSLFWRSMFISAPFQK